MIRYALLNAIVLGCVLAFVLYKKPSSQSWKRIGMTIALLLFLTAIFDPLIIKVGIVAYDQSRILGLTFFGAPIEDFAYAIAAGLLVPVLWEQHE